VRRRVKISSPVLADKPSTDLDWRLLGAEALWHLWRSVDEDLVELATDALVAGLDSPTLRVLAGADPTSYYMDLGDLLAEALQELERRPPSPDDAALNLVRYVSWQIVSGRVPPIDGARRIERIGYDTTSTLDLVLEFSALDDEFGGGWGRSQDEVQEAIRSAALSVISDLTENGSPG
jgi:hypothetical protein